MKSGERSSASVIAIMDNETVQCVRALGPHTTAVSLKLKHPPNKIQIKIGHLRYINEYHTTVCTVYSAEGTLTYISASMTHIAAVDAVEKNVTIFSAKGDKLFTLGSKNLLLPWGVYLHKNFVLITDHQAGCLYKYPLKDRSRLQWVCRQLINATGVCMDEKRFIYVASLGTPRSVYAHIHLIAPTGNVMNAMIAKNVMTKSRTFPDGSI